MFPVPPPGTRLIFCAAVSPAGRCILVVYPLSRHALLLNKENRRLQWSTHAKDNKIGCGEASHSQRIIFLWRKKVTTIQGCMAIGRVHTTLFRTGRDRSRPVARVHTGATGTLVPVSRDHLATWNERARSIAIGCALSPLSCGRSTGR